MTVAILKTCLVPSAAYSSVKARDVNQGNLHPLCFEKARSVDASFSRVACPLKPFIHWGVKAAAFAVEAAESSAVRLTSACSMAAAFGAHLLP